MSSHTIDVVGLVISLINMVLQFVGLVALIIYVWKTWVMADATQAAVRVSQDSLKELREAREQENSPYVVVFFDVTDDTLPDGTAAMRGLELVIKNIGKTFATNVRVSFEPPFESSYKEMLDRVLPEAGIAAIPPGHEIRTILDFFEKYKNSRKPMEFQVNVEYQGVLDNRVTKVSYRQDLMLYRGIMRIRHPRN